MSYANDYLNNFFACKECKYCNDLDSLGIYHVEEEDFYGRDHTIAIWVCDDCAKEKGWIQDKISDQAFIDEVLEEGKLAYDYDN